MCVQTLVAAVLKHRILILPSHETETMQLKSVTHIPSPPKRTLLGTIRLWRGLLSSESLLQMRTHPHIHQTAIQILQRIYSELCLELRTLIIEEMATGLRGINAPMVLLIVRRVIPDRRRLGLRIIRIFWICREILNTLLTLQQLLTTL